MGRAATGPSVVIIFIPLSFSQIVCDISVLTCIFLEEEEGGMEDRFSRERVGTVKVDLSVNMLSLHVLVKLKQIVIRFQ